MAWAGAWLAVPLPALAEPPRAPASHPATGHTFDAHEWAALDAACERLVPAGAEFPGARAANVVGFIDAQLADPHFASFRRELQAGAAALDAMALARSGSHFAALAGGEQDAILQALADGSVTLPGFASGHCFAVLLTLTLEGVFCHPRHGGNRNGVGFALLGFEPEAHTVGYPR